MIMTTFDDLFITSFIFHEILHYEIRALKDLVPYECIFFYLLPTIQAVGRSERLGRNCKLTYGAVS